MSEIPSHSQSPSISLLIDGLGAAALEAIQTAAAIFDRDFKILWINRYMAYIHGCNYKKVVGEYCYDVFKGCEEECDNCRMYEVLTTGRTVTMHGSVDMPNGRRQFGQLQAYPIRGHDKEIEAIMVIAFDTATKDNHDLKSGPLLTAQAGEETIKLSQREKQVLKLLAEGYTNTQISDLLSISSHTVKSYVIGIFNKLGVNDRTSAAVQAVRQNLI